ncbi:hypothetical protein FM109_00765 [Vibrio casei]|nr:hypothetical protein FM109_00765 [Vibrio casei]
MIYLKSKGKGVVVENSGQAQPDTRILVSCKIEGKIKPTTWFLLQKSVLSRASK